MRAELNGAEQISAGAALTIRVMMQEAIHLIAGLQQAAASEQQDMPNKPAQTEHQKQL